MRKTMFGVANSVDNIIAREDGGVDWLLWSDDVTAIMTEFWKSIDTVLMGRKTWEISSEMGPLPGMNARTYVFSRTMKQSPREDVTVVSQDAAGFVKKLKAGEGKDILVMGGGEFAQFLFEEDLIDEVHLNIHPVLLGSGVPLFLPMKRAIGLELIETRAIQLDCVLLTYRVKR